MTKHPLPIALAFAFALSLALVAPTGCKSHESSEAPNNTAAPAPEPATCGTVRNLSIAGDIYLAGQPGAKDFALLKARGVKTIINLRTPGESDLNEKKIVEDLGMTYVSLPWNGPDQLTDQKLDAMRTALHENERPIMLHCGSANRVGAGWLAYRVLDEGIPVEQALAEAKQIGMRTKAYETITLAYIHAARDDNRR